MSRCERFIWIILGKTHLHHSFDMSDFHFYFAKKKFLLDIVEFVCEEVIAILGMVFVAFFSQVAMEVHYFHVSVFCSTYCIPDTNFLPSLLYL